MSSLFWRQFKALFYKNTIVIRKHWLINILRCLIFPLAYGIFLGYVSTFFSKPSNFGLGTPARVFGVGDHFDGSRPIVWSDNSNGTGYIHGKDIMSHVTSGFSSRQLKGVIEVEDTASLFDICISNANGASPCFVALTFEDIPTASTSDKRPLNYTFWAGSGAYRVDVLKHTSDLETVLLPLQWAVDQAIIELTTGQKTPTPLQLPFTHNVDSDTDQSNRLLFLSIMGNFGGVVFFLVFTGVMYQIAGGVALERAAALTSHMQAMGALDSARLLSWYFSSSILFIPTWIALAVVWGVRIFTNTNIGYLILLHLVAGFGCTGWAFFASVPFSKSPQLAAVVTTGAAIVLAIIPLSITAENNSAVGPVLSFFFPSMFYVFMLKMFSGFEVNLQHVVLSQKDPTYFFEGIPMIIAAVVGVFFWPIVAIYLERWMYGISNPSNTGFWSSGQLKGSAEDTTSDIAISLRNVKKIFNTSMFSRKLNEVVAIADLTLDIPSFGIFVLLGPNGAGKSTALSIIGGLTKSTDGTVSFSGNTTRPPRGTLGLVPQKNVLFPELSCFQTLKLWNAIKQEEGESSDADIERLIRDCDLQSKAHEPAGTLSGGQKRKLQLAIGLVGGSKIILVDECTSGVDPLSRRSLWRTLTTYRNERTIVLTTHFLDEADFLADRIAVLAAPGKLIASESPVALKSSMGEGYSVIVKFESEDFAKELLSDVRTVAPDATMEIKESFTSCYHLKTRDSSRVSAALRLIEQRKKMFTIHAYDVVGTTIEDIFLDLLQKEEGEDGEKNEKDAAKQHALLDLTLSSGRPRSSLAQALTIFHKRFLIMRRSWLVPFLALAIGISGAWWPIRFVKGGVASCAHKFIDPTKGGFFNPLYPPLLSNDTILASPSNLPSIINASLPELFVDPLLQFYSPNFPKPSGPFNPFVPVADQQTLVEMINANFTEFSTFGGFSMDFEKNEYLIAWQLSPFSLSMFSVASNLFYNRALNASSSPSGSTRIHPTFHQLPSVQTESLATLQWLAIFGAAMTVFPAFFALYVAKERHSSVQAMQLSNGLSNPLGLWLGHIMFDSMFTVIVATVIAIVYAVVKSKFQGVGYLWFVICLYGFAATLLSYVTAIVIKSPLGAFAAMVVSQFIIYLLYLTAYIIVTFVALPLEAPRTINIVHFTLALIAPINSLVRAALISVNQFSLICDGENVATGAALGTITRYGGPILYLIVWILTLLFILTIIDSGIRFPTASLRRKANISGSLSGNNNEPRKPSNPDVVAEAQQAASFSNQDPLRVLSVSKSYGRNKVVDDVTFTIPHNSLFVMLGPNGAGKTTTFDMIYGQLKPDGGDVMVNDTSVLSNKQKARVSFGVCPQFTAIDAHLTVREHLLIYGHFRGLFGEDLQHNVDNILEATGLNTYSDRLATKLSGGNQRKLALSIALIGNPSVVLVDEYSTGIDAKMKRELWGVLKQVTSDKAVFLTTHSMEEASYLATKVGIMSKRMLAVGSPQELEACTASYEVHFACHNRQDYVKVQAVMARIPGARMADDVATRFEIPIGNSENSSSDTSVASIFEILSNEKGFPEFTIGKSSLETAFIRIINQDSQQGHDNHGVDAKAEGKLWGIC
ncbi:ABC transporter A family member 2 [Psilocybe cubensis]|uniref:ABC transporter A family member 2 n=2 Tax=Psilocybe cubensis TaxID=181762 RepID=A0ACB8HDU2_PSICU|nr:ABC transporter A family member 2 [Psilocybe cubensis]KAH9486190.1 ABC transporter A family member 2 [Psilocybe cubensis]